LGKVVKTCADFGGGCAAALSKVDRLPETARKAGKCGNRGIKESKQIHSISLEH